MSATIARTRRVPPGQRRIGSGDNRTCATVPGGRSCGTIGSGEGGSCEFGSSLPLCGLVPAPSEAVLEQRIGRAHRMGQQKPVHAYVLITTGTIEESLLATLAAKRELALAALDPDSDVERVDLAGSMDNLKRRLELLLGSKPEAPIDENERARNEQAAPDVDRKQRISEAGGQLVAAALRLLGELLPRPEGTAETQLGAALREQLAGAMETDSAGRPVFTLTLPDRSALDGIAQSLGGLLARASGTQTVLN